ncbi:unnamed protein product [Rotaria sp. Silwood1]|nr:unnamed protein product [Rotaria sp. Silwood1]
MPPPSLNIFDKLELHAKRLKSDNNQLKSLHERWKNILRKTKLDLTTLMREAKIGEIEEAKKEYQDLLDKLSDQLKESYNAICYLHWHFREEVGMNMLHVLYTGHMHIILDQDDQEMSNRWEEYGKKILALTKAGTTIDHQMAKQIAEECGVPLEH